MVFGIGNGKARGAQARAAKAELERAATGGADQLARGAQVTDENGVIMVQSLRDGKWYKLNGEDE